MSTASAGRQDQRAPLVSARARANVGLAGMVAWSLLAWHVAVAACTSVSLSQVGVTWDAIVTDWSPIGDLPGDPSTGALLAVWALVWFGGAAVLLMPVAYARGRWQRRRAGKGMAGRGEVRSKLGLDRARQRAEHDRPSMADGSWKKAKADQIGFVVGTEVHSRQEIVIPASAAVSVLGPTGAAKTNSVAAPACLTAPGALVVTTNEAGLVDLIATERAKKGTVWVFDPDDRIGWPHPMTWDPILGAADSKRALARGLSFADGCSVGNTSNGDFFRDTASRALRACFHAAALDDRRIEEVLSWSLDLESGYLTPYGIIQAATDPQVASLWANGLKAVSTGADDTVASTRTTLAGIVDPLLMPSVLRWVSRRDGVPNFDPDAFVRSTDTLVLISDASSATNVGPLCTMLFREVIDAIKRAAPFLPGRTLDPFLRIVGDEIANVAPIQNLAATTTEIRKLGVQTMVVFQSLSQLRMRWGNDGAEVLLEQMGAELVLPGLKDLRGLERYSGLAGMAEVLGTQVNTDASGYLSGAGYNVNERKALRPEEIRKMDDGRGLLMFSNAEPMMVDLNPWHAWDDADRLNADRRRVQQQRIAHLNNSGPDRDRGVRS